MRQVALTAAMVAVSAGLVGGCSSWRAPDTGQMTVAAAATGGLLDVQTANGSVEVRRADVPEVVIQATVRAMGMDRVAATRVVAEPGPEGGLSVRVVWPEGGRRSNEGCSLVIQTPDAAGVTIKTGNGQITIVGLGGHADLGTSNGRVEVTDHRGSVDVTTSNGRIELARVDGDVAAKSSNGRIEVVDATGAVKAQTSNGAIRVRLAETSTGPITAKTSNGSVRAEVSRAYAGEFDAKTSNGRVVVAGATSVKSGKSWANAKFGEGGSSNVLSTSNGRIDVVTIE